MELNIINYGNYKGGVDIFTILLKNELEQHYKVNIKLNDRDLSKYDIIHNNNAYIPYISDILTLHSIEFESEYIKYLKNTINNTKYITGVSIYQKKLLKHKYGIKINKIINNFTDMFYYKKTLYPKSRILNIGYIGRLDKEKGINDLYKLSNDIKNIKINLIGYNQDNYKQTKTVKIYPHIQNREALAQSIDTFDIAVFPTYNDTAPIAIMDCIARKIPTYARDIKPLKAVFKNSITYFKDYGELKELINGDIEYNKIENGYKYAYNYFNPVNNVNEYWKLYNKMVI
jgi:glycosyltransferase involved in cell wall biosynthesis